MSSAHEWRRGRGTGGGAVSSSMLRSSSCSQDVCAASAGASGGTGTIFVDGQKVTEGRISNTTPFIFSADETADVGTDEATPVTEEYAEGDNEFTGKIERVTVTLK